VPEGRLQRTRQAYQERLTPGQALAERRYEEGWKIFYGRNVAAFSEVPADKARELRAVYDELMGREPKSTQ